MENYYPLDQIVFVGVASKHRQDSFDACNFVMDWLKTQAPFWKIEDDGNKKKWVEFNSLDNDAVKKWIGLMLRLFFINQFIVSIC